MSTTSPSFDDRFDALASIGYRVAYRLVGDRSEAEQVVQEALARAFAHWNKVSSYDEAWVTRVTTNLSIAYWRRQRPTVGSAHEPVVHTERVAERVDLSQALKRLPKRQREVLALRYLADLTEAETAERLGCSVGTVKQHASRGLKGMRHLLGDPAVTSDGTATHRIDTTGATETC